MWEWMSQKTRTMPGRSKRTDLRAAARVAAEVEAVPLREREDVVVRAVAVGEVHGGAGGHGQHVGHERLVALVHDRARLAGQLEGARAARVSRYTTLRRRSGRPGVRARPRRRWRAGPRPAAGSRLHLHRPRMVPRRGGSAANAAAAARRARPRRAPAATHGQNQQSELARDDAEGALAAAVAAVVLVDALQEEVAPERVADAALDPQDRRVPRDRRPPGA